MRPLLGSGLLSLCLLGAAVACSGDIDTPDGGGDQQERDPLAAPQDVAAPPADADVTGSGLASKVLVAGTGTERPSETDRVRVHYSGWRAANGELFDSSYRREGPLEFAVGAVIEGWTEGLQLMVEGELRRLWIPADLAYGEMPSDPRRPAGALTFDVELLEIVTP